MLAQEILYAPILLFSSSFPASFTLPLTPSIIKTDCNMTPHQVKSLRALLPTLPIRSSH